MLGWLRQNGARDRPSKMSETRARYRTSCVTTKYGNRKTEWNGQLFDSRAELADYIALLARERAGAISGLRRQPGYVLQEGFTDNEGHKVLPILYIADFEFLENGQVVVFDTKGYASREFAIKRKLFLKRYPQIRFVVNKKSTARRF